MFPDSTATTYGVASGALSQTSQVSFMPVTRPSDDDYFHTSPQFYPAVGIAQNLPTAGFAPIRPLHTPVVPSLNPFKYRTRPSTPVYPFGFTNKFEIQNDDAMSTTPTYIFNDNIMSSGYSPGDEVAVGKPLSEVDTRGLTAKQVLFYFGVLTLVEPHLQPNFEYSRDLRGNWTAKLSLYRETISIPSLQTRMAAKVEICRVALSLLKPRYASWRVPDEPSLVLTAPEWLWGLLLEGKKQIQIRDYSVPLTGRDYAYINELPCPVFTKYVHEYGYRYETDVGNVTCLGFRKFYDTEIQAADAAAHQTLYLLLTEGSSELALPIPEDSERIKLHSPETLPVKEEDTLQRTNNVSKINKAAEQDSIHVSRAERLEYWRRLPKRGKKRRHDFMSNLVPLSHSRISTADVNDEPEQQSKWGITPHALLRELRPLKTWSEKVHKMCDLLHLTPKFTIESSPIELHALGETVKSYSIWVVFQDDPFLARVGAIGKVVGFQATEADAKEACCQKVYDYLFELVREDNALENQERECREQIRNFGQVKRMRLEENGYALPR